MVDAYNRWFPDFPGQTPYQDPQFVAKFGGGQSGPAQPTRQQPLTPPMIHADIIQVSDAAEAERYQINVGASQMFITRSEEQIYIKEQHPNGYVLTTYDRRPPEPPREALDTAKYVTWDKLEERLAEMTARRDDGEAK